MTLEFTRLTELTENTAQHVPADPQARPLELGDCELAGECIHCRFDQLCLRPARALELPDALLELPVRFLHNEEDESDVRPRIVAAFVPALGPDLERLVVALFVLLDEPLQTDEAADFKAQVIALE